MLVKLLSLLSLGALALASPAAAGTFIPRQPLAKLQPMPQQQQTEQVSELTKAVLTLDHKYSSALRKQQSAMVDFGLNATVSAPATMSRDYNAATAKQLYWLSSTAYCTDNANLSAWNCNTCRNFGAFTVTAVMDDTDNQGYVGYFTQGLPSAPMPGVGANEPFVVVAFRGTMPTDFKDWLEDLNFAKATPFGSTGANVHTGFWQAYLDMRPKLLVGLEQAFSQSGARGLITVGHSLGGAMAELAAVDLKLNYYTSKVYASYTQGTPRPGDAKWAQLYANTVAASFREIHYADVVPHLPPHLLGFTHSSTEVWFDEAFANYTVCSGDNGEDPACAQSLTLPISIPDHLSYHGTVPMACTDV